MSTTTYLFATHALSGPLRGGVETLLLCIAGLAALLILVALAARAGSALPEGSEQLGPAATIPPDRARRQRRTRVLIVGAGRRGRDLAQALLARADSRYDIVGFVDDEAATPGWNGIPVLGALRDVASLVERHAVDEIMVAHALTWHDVLVNQLVAAGREDQVRVSCALGLRDAMTADLRLHTVADMPFIAVNGRHPSPWFPLAKRAFDIGFSLAALIITGPLILLLALAVKATSRGPAFFCQRRVGWRGREFTIYKLRTMVADAERDSGPRLADPYDARATPLGRLLRITRLDELPQFFNVLKGDMSVVGPRPERPEFVSRFLRQVPGYRKRLEVRPGITGLAQVCGGYDTDVYDKLKYDWIYVYRQSLWLEIKILLRTVRTVLLCAGQ